MSAKAGGDAASKWQDLPQQLWQSMLDAARPLLPEAGAVSDPIQRLMAMLGGAGDGLAGQAGQRLLAGGEQFVQWAQQLIGGLADGHPGAQQPTGSAQWTALFEQSLAGFPEASEPLLKLMQQGIDLVARPLAAGVMGGDRVAPLRAHVDTLLGLPNFGFAREHQERRQKLARAALAFQDAMGRYQSLLGKAGQQGIERLRGKLAEREEPGRQIETLRGLYDLWIDAAEEAYAEIALSSEFRTVYGELVNRQMALRQAVQTEVEHHCGELGLPTRSELNAVHGRLHSMRRQLRALEQQLAGTEAVQAPAADISSPPGPTTSARAGSRKPPKAAARAARKPAGKAAAKAEVRPRQATSPKPRVRSANKAVKPARSARPAKSGKPAATAKSAVSRRALHRFA